MSFKQLGLSEPLQQAVKEQGYDTPSPIQAQAIPVVLSGQDLMAAAQTGTGKTAGFTLPILERLSQGRGAHFNAVRALVLTPTRELAAQVEDSVKTYSKHLKIRSTVVFGGVKINPQMQRLRRGVDVLVATPGRLLDLYSQNAIRFDDLEVLVLDEADRMLDMGFIHDIKRIIKLLPKKRQNLLFSATFSPEIKQLAQSFLNHPAEIAITPEKTTAERVAQKLHPVDKKRKKELLLHLIATGQWQQVLVFSRTKHGANRIADYLNKYNITATAIHGNKSQGARTRALAAFKQGDVRVMVATDIAARGIDIDLLPHVVNIDLPNVPEDYVHRIGRTGRAGAAGEAVSLVSADEYVQLFDIEKLLGHPIRREYVDGFEPSHEVPTSPAGRRRSERQAMRNSDAAPNQKRKKPKKPKKRPFVKAAVKAKWANRSPEENQAARERSQKAKAGQPNAKQKKNPSKKHPSQSKSRSQSAGKGSKQSASKRQSPWSQANQNKSGQGRRKQRRKPS